MAEIFNDGTLTIGGIDVKTLGRIDKVKLELKPNTKEKRGWGLGKYYVKTDGDPKLSLEIEWTDLASYMQSLRWAKQDTNKTPLPCVLRYKVGPKSPTNPEFTFDLVWDDPGAIDAAQGEEFASSVSSSINGKVTADDTVDPIEL